VGVVSADVTSGGGRWEQQKVCGRTFRIDKPPILMGGSQLRLTGKLLNKAALRSFLSVQTERTCTGKNQF